MTTYLRTNYRLTGGLLDVDGGGSFNSILFVMSLADIGRTKCAPGDGPITCSTGGYGAPAFVGVVGISNIKNDYCASLPVYYKVSGDMSGSVFFLNAYMSDSWFSHTINTQFLVLIGSR